MSADSDRERLRDRARDLLDIEDTERPPCPQILGIGLVEEVCEDDEAMKRWLACQAVEFAVNEGRDIEDALAEAFDMAEDQCEFFDLPFPGDRQTSFGPLQAQEVREERRERSRAEQSALPGVDDDEDDEPPRLEPQRGGRRERGEQTGLGGPAREESARATEAVERRQERAERRAAEETPRQQERLGSGRKPARLSEFEGGPGPLGDRLPAELEDVVGEQVTVTIDGTEHTLPNSVATWERVGNASHPEWRSQNVDGYDAVIVDQQAGGWRAIVGTAPRRGESLRNIDILQPIGAFGAAAASAVEFMRNHPDGRGQGNGSRPSSTRSR